MKKMEFDCKCKVCAPLSLNLLFRASKPERIPTKNCIFMLLAKLYDTKPVPNLVELNHILIDEDGQQTIARLYNWCQSNCDFYDIPFLHAPFRDNPCTCEKIDRIKICRESSLLCYKLLSHDYFCNYVAVYNKYASKRLDYELKTHNYPIFNVTNPVAQKHQFADKINGEKALYYVLIPSILPTENEIEESEEIEENKEVKELVIDKEREENKEIKELAIDKEREENKEIKELVIDKENERTNSE